MLLFQYNPRDSVIFFLLSSQHVYTYTPKKQKKFLSVGEVMTTIDLKMMSNTFYRYLNCCWPAWKSYCKNDKSQLIPLQILLRHGWIIVPAPLPSQLWPLWKMSHFLLWQTAERILSLSKQGGNCGNERLFSVSCNSIGQSL